MDRNQRGFSARPHRLCPNDGPIWSKPRPGREKPTGYDDENQSYTPAWQERWSGVGRDTVIKFAREWASTAEKTEGKCMVIIGAGINHWYHNNLIYRSAITALDRKSTRL